MANQIYLEPVVRRGMVQSRFRFVRLHTKRAAEGAEGMTTLQGFALAAVASGVMWSCIVGTIAII